MPPCVHDTACVWQHGRQPKIIPFDSLDVKWWSLVAVTSGGGSSERRQSLFPMQMLASNYINDVVRRVLRLVCLSARLKDQQDALNNIIAGKRRRPITRVAFKSLKKSLIHLFLIALVSKCIFFLILF